MMSDAAPAWLPDPSPRLTAAFGVVAQRMAGLGFVNPALQVEAVGFAPWQGHWLGVMVTPWFMNLVLMPRDRSQWQALAVGAKRKLQFPAGLYEFIGADDAAIGEHQTCSLFSPMHEFESHDAARLVAQLARDALLDPANADAHEFTQAPLSPVAAEPPAAAQARGAEGTAARSDAGVSKRDFLRGRFGGKGEAERP